MNNSVDEASSPETTYLSKASCMCKDCSLMVIKKGAQTEGQHRQLMLCCDRTKETEEKVFNMEKSKAKQNLEGSSDSRQELTLDEKLIFDVLVAYGFILKDGLKLRNESQLNHWIEFYQSANTGQKISNMVNSDLKTG